jgi:hypothetical protein
MQSASKISARDSSRLHNRWSVRTANSRDGSIFTAELEGTEERIRLERLAAISEMAMDLAHEMSNPLEKHRTLRVDA